MNEYLLTGKVFPSFLYGKNAAAQQCQRLVERKRVQPFAFFCIE